MLQTFLVASQQQQHFNIQQFQRMYTQQNTQQSEVQKDPDEEDQESDQEYDRQSDEEEVCQIFLLDVTCVFGIFCKTNENERSFRCIRKR